MGNHEQAEKKRNPHRAILRVLGEVAETVPHRTPTRAETAANAARLLTRLLAGDTQRQAS
jgi:hypothetical protein